MYEFHVLTIGQFSRNRFWGESEDHAYRDALCTSTLLKGERNIVVDPSLPSEQMRETLFNRTGLTPADIHEVFITHAHGDHFTGLECFPNAAWYMGEGDLRQMRNSENPREKELAMRIQPAAPGFLPGIELLPLPGHTMGLTGVLFQSPEGRAVVCGDAVMTRDFFREKLGYYNSVDFALSAESIVKLGELADIIIPGHDNYFPAAVYKGGVR